jgi:hypothetical protein
MGMGAWKHRLSEIDPVARTGTCAVCGPNTPLYPRKRNVSKRRGWSCSCSHKTKRKTPTAHPWKHRLSDINASTKTATCSVCGPGTNVRSRKDGTKRKWVCKEQGRDRARKRGPDAWTKARESLVAAQDGRCAICRRQRRLVLDHCHKTGKKRAALCSSCNVAIGLLGEDPVRIRDAANYVEKHAHGD